MVTFNEVKKTFESKGCQFLISEEEFNKTKHSTTEKYKYIASCGHPHKVWLNVFRHRSTGVICPKCVISNDAIRQKEQAIIDPIKNLNLEYKNIKYFQDLVSNTFDVKITREGCLADIAMKPVDTDADLWIRIQVKSNEKPLRDYGFKCDNRYPNCIILCICHSDKRMWALDGNNINVSNKIAIGLHKSKYSENEITMKNLHDKFKSFYETYPKYDFHTINTCITTSTIRI